MEAPWGEWLKWVDIAGLLVEADFDSSVQEVEFAGKVGVAKMNDLEVKETWGVVLTICETAFVELCQMELSVQTTKSAIAQNKSKY